MKTISKISIFIVCISLFFSCKKNDSPAVATVKTYVSKITYSSVGTYDYTYDDQGRLQQEVYSGNAFNPATTTYFTAYDAQGRITQTTTYYPAGTYAQVKSVLTYNGSGNLTRTDSYPYGSTVANQYTLFTYSTNKITLAYFNGAGASQGSTEYTLSADGKNITGTKGFTAAGAVSYESIYTFDTHICPDQLFPVGYAYSPVQNSNNWLTRAQTISGTTTNLTFTYEYNSDGYVTKRTASSGSTSIYEYIKK